MWIISKKLLKVVLLCAVSNTVCLNPIVGYIKNYIWHTEIPAEARLWNYILTWVVAVQRQSSAHVTWLRLWRKTQESKVYLLIFACLECFLALYVHACTPITTACHGTCTHALTWARTIITAECGICWTVVVKLKRENSNKMQMVNYGYKTGVSPDFDSHDSVIHTALSHAFILAYCVWKLALSARLAAE